MQANYFILSFVGIPLFGFILTLIIPANREMWMSRTAVISTGIHLLTSVLFFIFWALDDFHIYNVEELTLYQSREYRFIIDFLFDGITATYLLVGSLITFLIVRYSQYYMHLESGYKGFLNTILFFFSGYNFTLLSGNFETLFIGWEILGVSSFLLIAFYRERYIPVRNAVKVFSIYRIGDIGVLAAMWASHHLWHENITFIKLENAELVHEHFAGNSDIGIFIGVALLIAAAAKSAQIPFSSWLPRAMEGPSPSSAIFYGSLSVHFGVFLLMRTYPLWEEQLTVRIIIVLTGLFTAIAAHSISQVQSSIKPQIAYASAAQIGIMFIEIALGWHTLALIHFAGNAFLRTYQLLISPSIVNYLIRDQLYHFTPGQNVKASRLKDTIYLLSLKEWYLDDLMSSLFNRIKQGGKWLSFIHLKNVVYFFTPLYLAGLLLYLNPSLIPGFIRPYLPVTIAITGLLMVLRSFAERKHPRLAWVLIIFNHLSLALAVSFNEKFHYYQTLIFISGIVFSGIVGYVCLSFMRSKEKTSINLFEYKGFVLKYPRVAFIYFVATLGLMGFPVTPSFVGQDLLFSHIHQDQYGLALIIAFSFIISGISLIRIYARIFLGPYIKPDQSHPLKTS